MRTLFIFLIVATLSTSLACFVLAGLGPTIATVSALDLALCVGVAAGAYAGFTSLMFR